MKINYITPYNIQTPDKNLQLQTKQSYNSAPPPNLAKLPSTKDYLSFTGGYSLDLAKTIERLDILAKKKSNLYPPNIREWAGMILQDGNKAGETLIDIHKKFYSSLKECFSLKEIKEKFPEFNDVISSDNVKAAKGSFIDKFQKGELEFFDNDEDLSVQLIKLYWGEGFSLNDLKRYADGQDLYHTMKKLNIPTADRDYGHILKFSDAQYNERLTREMTEKRLAALDRKAQLNDGEPVYIKRGPMSKEHRERISEGLKKYYQENPEKLYEISERQKEFYRENPERAKILSRVANKAWNIFGADRIKAALSKFMKGKGFKDFNAEELESPLSFSKQKSMALKQFWGANDWAKKSFSKNMEYAWKKVKEEENTIYNITHVPKSFMQKVINWSEKNLGVELTESDFKAFIHPNSHEKDYFENPKINMYTRMYADSHKGESTIMANTYFLAMLNTNRVLSKIDLSKTDKESRILIKTMREMIKASLFENPELPVEKTNFRTLETDQIQKIYAILKNMCYDTYNPKYANIMDTQLNKAYDYISRKWSPDNPIKLTPFGLDL